MNEPCDADRWHGDENLNPAHNERDPDLQRDEQLQAIFDAENKANMEIWDAIERRELDRVRRLMK